jgi:hypothetical protein
MGCLTRAGDVRTGRGYLCDVVRRMFWNLESEMAKAGASRNARYPEMVHRLQEGGVILSISSIGRLLTCARLQPRTLLSQSVQGYSSREAHGRHADLLVCCALLSPFPPHPRVQQQIPPILLHPPLSIINLPVKSAHTRLYLTSRKRPIMAEDSPFNRKTYGLPEDSRPFISDRTIREQRLKAARKTPRVSM